MNEPSDFVSRDVLLQVVDLARAAGQAILQVYETDFAVETKADNSPLTAADRAAHELISSGLERIAPAIPVLSEESVPYTHAYEYRRNWPALWLVDPLDGTREFVGRNGEFTVNIALIARHEPVLGVVYAPALGQMYYAARSIGAWQQSHQEPPASLQARSAAREIPVVAASRSHRSPTLDALLERLGPHEIKPVGSALKFCLVANGTADLYPRFGSTSEWDTAAGQAILEVAGGQVTDLQGHALRYNARATLINPSFLAFADRTREWRRLM